MSLARGTLVLVVLDRCSVISSNESAPACVVLSDVTVNSNQRLSLIAVVPVTGTLSPGSP